MEFCITQSWNGGSINHAPVKVKIAPNSTSDLKLSVYAPYFGDPPAPDGPSGLPFPQLWDYEVVELFLLNDDDRYIEVELCPHGQHLVLLLNGIRNIVKDELSIQYKASIEGSRWSGESLLPLEYLPPNVNRMNAFAIHGSENNRVYEALHPANTSFPDPDFHRLEFFQPINMSFIPGYNPSTVTQTWKNILEK
ncbi:UPF0462 protein C4orf33 homolog [Patella vulgata]|uniref:UPF0462 protein C4orf33 homolog n=1 Tax=Patella vulgata TaxID=6465 RepID=UPI00217FE858|nr:UPF0462 protein C4orf33 homolog [Patella vulgata]